MKMTREECPDRVRVDREYDPFTSPNPDSPQARRDEHIGDTRMGITTATECWPSLNRTRAGLPNGDGMRRCVATRPVQAGRHGSAI
jgi:hypothetical protein